MQSSGLGAEVGGITPDPLSAPPTGGIRWVESTSTTEVEVPKAGKLILAQMVQNIQGNTKENNKLFEHLKQLLGERWSQKLVAKHFATYASSQPNVVVRSRAYKLACRYAPIDVVAKAFARQNVRVICPCNHHHPHDLIGIPKNPVISATAVH